MKPLAIAKLGLVDYARALALLEKVHEARVSGRIPDTLLLLEHPDVITIGRRGKRSNITADESELRKRNIRVYETSRGGDVTYHGPGQLVGYPVFDLRERGCNIRLFVSGIEETFSRLLEREFDIRCSCGEGRYTGLWIDNDKILAMGIAVRHWVTMHGFAFNINTNLDGFGLITPCGIADRGVTSLEKLLGAKQDFGIIVDKVCALFCDVFDSTPEYITLEELERKLA
jgi:lipoyl(octanoyl) transferase